MKRNISKFALTKLLPGVLLSGLLAFSTTGRAADTLISTLFTVSSTSGPSGSVDASEMVVGDQYLLSFDVDTSSLCSTVFTNLGGQGGQWNNAITSFTMTALPGNTGTWTPGTFSIASSYVQVAVPNGSEDYIYFSVTLSGGNSIDYTADSRMPPFTPTAGSSPLSSSDAGGFVIGFQQASLGQSLSDFIPETWTSDSNGRLQFGSPMSGVLVGTDASTPINTVPEPSVYALLGMGMILAIAAARRKSPAFSK